MLRNKTYLPKVDKIERKWFLIDAEGEILGRLATKIATILMGKHKVIYTPFFDTGDYVIVINAEKVIVTGNKRRAKNYYIHTTRPGSMKVIPFFMMQQKHPERVIQLAVKRMLPKNKLGRKMLKKLKVYAGSEHPHAAQQPVKILV